MSDRTPASRSVGLYLQGRLLQQALVERMPNYAAKDFAAALAGDEEAAARLTTAAPNDLRGHCAVLLYLQGSVEVLRAFLAPAWMHDHHQVIVAARNKQRLQAMFRRAGYPLPNSLPTVRRVYRGTAGISRVQAARGAAWTFDRDTACWFAMRFAEYRGQPLVLSAEMKRSEIAHYTNERSEQEVVIVGGVPNAQQDGEPADWAERAAFVQTRNAAALQSYLTLAA